MTKTKRCGGVAFGEREVEKSDWKCPACGGDLSKKPETGEGVKHCIACQRGWFYRNDQ
jgi:PHP family Zn ribbon phosphoesterase